MPNATVLGMIPLGPDSEARARFTQTHSDLSGLVNFKPQ